MKRIGRIIVAFLILVVRSCIVIAVTIVAIPRAIINSRWNKSLAELLISELNNRKLGG